MNTKSKVSPAEKLEKLKLKLEANVAKMQKIRDEKLTIQLDIKAAIREAMGTKGGRGRGSANFGKIKPAIVAYLSNAEAAKTVKGISEAIGFSYASVYQTLRNHAADFRCVNKHWALGASETKVESVVETPTVEQPSTSVAA